MPRIVVFLRGINVGGHTVTKEKLLQIFASIGLPDVSVFKQSGNLILESEIQTPEHIRKLAENGLCQALSFGVTVFVRTMPQLKELVQLEPFTDYGGENADFQVTFLAKVPSEFSLRLPFRIPNSTADIISIHGTEIFSITRGHGDGGKPNPFLETRLKTRATTRNWNVIKEIIEGYA